MAQWEMALAAKPKNVSSIPLIHVVEAESCPLTSTRELWHVCQPPPPHTHTQINSGFKGRQERAPSLHSMSPQVLNKY